MRWCSSSGRALALMAAAAAAGCGLTLDLDPPEGQSGDGGRFDAAPTDASVGDSAAQDASFADSGPDCVPMPESCNGVDDDCNGLVDDPFDTQTDPNNCGACGVPRSDNHGVPGCNAGSCETLCDPGFDDCDGDPSNGCETSLGAVTDCGACGMGCAAALFCRSVGSSYECSDGCDGLTTCGMSCVDTNTDLTHCGGCNRGCATPGASPVCTGGSCGYSSCLRGWGDCDGDVANGCETRLDVPGSCGSCFLACVTGAHSTTVCTPAMVCDLVCDPGYADCRGSLADGCETALGTLTDCSFCGDVCSGGQECIGDVCVDTLPGRCDEWTEFEPGCTGGGMNCFAPCSSALRQMFCTMGFCECEYLDMAGLVVGVVPCGSYGGVAGCEICEQAVLDGCCAGPPP